MSFQSASAKDFLHDIEVSPSAPKVKYTLFQIIWKRIIMFSKNKIHVYMLNTKNDYFRKALTY